MENPVMRNTDHFYLPVLFLITIFLANPVSGQVNKFKFQPDKVLVGTAFHYVKTNHDGTNPEKISVYIAARDKIEVFKFHPENPGSRSALVMATMDWETFSAKRLEAWTMTGADQKSLAITMQYAPEKKAVTVEVGAAGQPREEIAIGFLPFHVYNFDFTSLNMTLPHLIDPKGKFQIGVADPVFSEGGPLFLYRGEAQMEYAGDEERNGASCRKYRVDGKGLDNRGGYIWVSRETGYFVDTEIDLPDNPNWNNFKLKLEKTEKLTPEKWVAFYQKHFGK